MTRLLVRHARAMSQKPLLILIPCPAAVLGVSFKSDPTTLNDFNTTSSGQAYPLLLPTFSTTVEGSFCVNVNVSSLGVSGVTNGTLATILMVYNGGDGLLHQVRRTPRKEC